jgi:hypothetical protein
MSLKQTRYDGLPTHELARDPHEPRYSRESDDEHESNGLLAPLYEKVPKPLVVGLIGAAGMAGYFNLPQKLASRISEVAHPHEITKTKTVDNARSPLAGYSHVPHTVTYKTPEISGK